MRLIDADSFELNVQSEWERSEISSGDWMLIRQLINEEPTVDAVEVVRCRECKQGDMELCHSIWSWFGDDGFCIFGKRRTE